MNKAKRYVLTMPVGLVLMLLKLYRGLISPYLGHICRFHPSCSVYAIEVLSTFGLVKGGILTLKRLSKCHPFHPGGVDLPPKPSSNDHSSCKEIIG